MTALPQSINHCVNNVDLHHDQYQSHHFFQSLSKSGHHTHTRFMHRYLACSCTDALSPAISPCDILQKWVIELANKDESVAKELKGITLEGNFESTEVELEKK